jgi:hypothetical protein
MLLEKAVMDKGVVFFLDEVEPAKKEVHDAMDEILREYASTHTPQETLAALVRMWGIHQS